MFVALSKIDTEFAMWLSAKTREPSRETATENVNAPVGTEAMTERMPGSITETPYEEPPWAKYRRVPAVLNARPLGPSSIGIVATMALVETSMTESREVPGGPCVPTHTSVPRG